MTRKCIVPRCKSGYASSREKVSLFHVPKVSELQGKWIRAIPKANVPITSAHVVCEKHFVPSDIIRDYIHKDAAGNIIAKVRLQHPRLTDTAVPSIFPNVPQYFDATKDIKVEKLTEEEVAVERPQIGSTVLLLVSPNIEEHIDIKSDIKVENLSEDEVICRASSPYSLPTTITHRNIANHDHNYTHRVTHPNFECAKAESPSPNLKDAFSDILRDETVIAVPRGWFRYTDSGRGKWVAFSTFDVQNQDDSLQPLARKSALLSEDGTVHVSAHGKTLPSKSALTLFSRTETVDDLGRLLVRLSNARICSGVALPRDAQSVQDGAVHQDAFGAWRHKDCAVLCANRVCLHCQRLRKRLQQKSRRLSGRKEERKRLIIECRTERDRENCKALRRKIRLEAAATRRAREKIKKLQGNMCEVRETIRKLSKQ